MQTDAVFYELFSLEPQALMELIGLTLPYRYQFRSITVKTTEKRIDGVFEPEGGQGPILILEVQG